MNELTSLFLVIGLGYLLGSINFFGIRFGNSAIILVGIVLGHFGVTIPETMGTLGLVMFIGAVGLKAGKSILYYFKNKGLAFLVIPLVVVLSSGILLSLFYAFTDFPYDLLIGILSGAMTSTTALASAQELGAGELAAVGYGIAYILGVILVVAFVQLVPRFYGVNSSEEINKLEPPKSAGVPSASGLKKIDRNGLFVFFTTLVLGMLLGSITIPLGNDLTFSLGNSGGPLIMGLVLGHFKNIGKINLNIPNDTLNLFSSFGISLFLADSGIAAGAGFMDVVTEYGFTLILMGAGFTVLTSFIGFILAYYIFKIPMYGSLGTTTGSMTSAPSLGALIDSSGTDLVTPFYAATQPIATILLVFLPQVLNLIF